MSRAAPRSALRLAALAAGAALLGCGNTLYSAAGLPSLGDGNLTCQPNETACDVGLPKLVCLDVESTPQHCGGCLNDCTVSAPPPPGATSVCVNRACGFECPAGKLKSGAVCAAAVALSAGEAHTCAITDDARLHCWGANATEQVGAAAANPQATPFDVGRTGIVAVAAGQGHTCASDGASVACWGANGSGQAAPPALPGAVQLAAGQGHTCALTGSGTVTCWGAGPAATPPALSGVAAIASGANHACALTSGTVTCWGANDRGQLGNGTVTPAASSTPSLPAGIGLLAAGRDHTCAADPAGGILCWGDGSARQLPGLSNPQTTPAAPPKSGGGGNALVQKVVLKMAAGGAHTCVLEPPQDGIGCFGADGQGQLGGPFAGELVALGVASDGATALTAGGAHTCAVYADGLLRCWGSNGSGQLGDGSTSTPAIGTLVLVSGK